MATIFFADEGTEITVADGASVKDAVDEHGAEIPFGCREGACATCVIRVKEGAEFLNSLTENEEMTLLPNEIEEGLRLACQLTVSGGRISIQPAE